MSVNLRKTIFLILMLLSYIPIVLVLDYSYLRDAVSATKFIASACGMFGVIMIAWQYLMGVRGLISKLIPDLLWVNSVHRKIGTYGFLLITMHPVFMTFYYLSVGINFLIPSFSTAFDQFRLVGELAYLVMAFTWVSSALLRDRISFRWWKRIHIFNLVILPLALIHSLNIGTTLLTTDMRLYWYVIALVAVSILIYRFILFKYFGVNRLAYTVTAIHKVLDDVVQIDMAPVGDALLPQPGQFVYVHPLDSKETHPFTASRYNQATKELSISPKASGPFSNNLQSIQLYSKIWIDGPYGVFTKEAYTTVRPIMIIAGGIGITPFVRLIEKLGSGWNRHAILLYGNQTEQDIAYRELIADTAAANPEFKAINILSRQESYVGETGYVDIARIRKYIEEPLTDYDYFLCGPPAMMKAVTKQLREAGVSSKHIFSERFSL